MKPRHDFILFSFCGFPWYSAAGAGGWLILCRSGLHHQELGKAAEARAGIMLTPPGWSGGPSCSGGVPDSDTDPDPREACRIKEKQKQKPELGHRILTGIERPVLRALGSRFIEVADPSGRAGGNALASKKSAN
jgi:hypothetical protein